MGGAVVQPLWGLLDQTHRRLSRLLDERLTAAVGLGHRSVDLLDLLCSARGPLTMSELGLAVGLSRAGATTAVRALAARDLVATARTTADRRLVHVRITATGRALVRRAAVVRAETEREVLARDPVLAALASQLSATGRQAASTSKRV